MHNKFLSHQQIDAQRGQALVLIAAALIGLLAFVGIAVDVGFVFARNSQLQAGVDAAALAGVVELAGGDLNAADDKAGRFLKSNNIPITTTTSPTGTATLESVTYQTQLQETAYALTVTWPVELFFLRVIGWDDVTIKKSATAAFLSLTDIYAGSRVDQGKLSTSTQGVFGPQACTGRGDPYSPYNSPFRPPGYPGNSTYTYRYRILIPPSYPDNVLRVELFDPDTHNENINQATVVHTSYAVNNSFPAWQDLSCDSSNRQNPCLIETGEESLVSPPNVTIDQINPFWFVRVDENREPKPDCDPPNGVYVPDNNTQTIYQLSYYLEHTDGTIQEIPLAAYTGLKDNNHDTDLHWVSPGAPPSFDYPGPSTGVPADLGSFQINLDTDVPNILTEQSTGNRYIYLNVTASHGSSENGFEIWAGPDDYINSVPSDANERNIHVLDSPGAHNSAGAVVFALGTLPLNSSTDNRVDIPLVYISPNYAGETIHISLFDSDTGTVPPITFFFDSLAYNPGPPPTGDWFMEFGDPNNTTDPDGVPVSTRCNLASGDCNNEWIDPAYKIIVPGDLENCDYNNPTTDCTPFYGGRLMASYQGGQHDTYVWEISIAGAPYLKR